MKAAATPAAMAVDNTDSVLAGLAASAPTQEATVDTTADVLAGLAANAPEQAVPEDAAGDILASLAAAAPDEEEQTDTTSEVLAGLAANAPDDVVPEDTSSDVLADLVADAPVEAAPDTATSDLLAGMAATAPVDEVKDDGAEALLAGMASNAPTEEATDTTSDDLLSAMAESALAEDKETPEDDSTDVLAAMAADNPAEEGEDTATADLLADMAEGAPDDTAEDSNDLDGLLSDITAQATEMDEVEDQTDTVLEALADDVPDEEADDSSVDDLLGDMAADTPEDEADESEDLDALLADVAGDVTEEDDSSDDLDALLADVVEEAPEDEADESEDLDALLADVAGDVTEEDDSSEDLDALLADVVEDAPEDEADESEDLDALLADVGEDVSEKDNADDLDEFFAGVTDDTDAPDDLADDDSDAGDDLDALFADDGDDGNDDEETDLEDLLADDEEDTDLDALLADSDEDTDLDDLLADDDDDTETLMEGEEMDADPTPPKAPYNPAFGKMTAPKPQINPGDRRKMRIAILGDFSGRANKGELQGGSELAARKAIKFDIDTVEDVIARFATTLTLPLGRDGSAIEVELGEIDDLHPDELYDNVEIFAELSSLRTQIQRGTNLDALTAKLQQWGGEFGDFKLMSKSRAKGASANASMQVSEFAALIGAEAAPKPEPTGIDAMIQRIVAPFVMAAPDGAQASMLAAVDQALGAAMSSILHHPDFQAVESNWRTLDMLARRIETGSHLELVLYDVAVEEFTADLAAHEDLGDSALYDMLVERPRLNEDQGPLAAVLGLYTFEETPPHAELLARMSKISAQMDAPFIAAMGAGFLQTKADDLHPMIAKTWAALRETPEAKYIALAAPRFLLRMPYGKKTEPVDPFDYEEFNTREGMRSLLMGNPATLVAILLAQTLAQQGAEISLGSIMSVDDMPFHYMMDQYGDQVALPSTERLINVRMSTETVQRGYLPVLSIQGQNVVRLGSFNALGGGELLGLWSGEEAKLLQSGKIQARTGVALGAGLKKPERAVAEDEDADGSDAADDDDDFGFGGGDDDDFDLGGDDDLDLDLGGDDDDDDLGLDFGDDDDLDDLLSGFDDDDDDGSDGDDDDMDDDLAALLADL
ncbi:type VI secretion system contractile sheath domain-containing protein [Roseobacter sp. N2S]|uniref:type VI secretion system contractile sheath domain-containing protein n=1 Tax=Roseobacter sp. N2S TaxID=2663844 RepID=UPI00286AC69D|nr:type VI secretion system contractile sheath large subunit [Roseobacter sp. N2S]